MTTFQKFGYIAVTTLLIGVGSAHALLGFGEGTVDDKIKGSQNTADVAVQNLVANVMLFLAIVAVLYGIYGGFLIVTAGGNEDGVKKGKTILIQVAIGLVVIFLANSIIQFVITKILKGG